jgi:hypothetical protein
MERDSDGDGTADFFDSDRDGDGAPNESDPLPDFEYYPPTERNC